MSGDPTEDTGETAVGDGRLKHVTVTTRNCERIEHGETYLKHAGNAFVVSPEASFPDDETTRYAKSELLRVDVTQHHSACFITTAVAGDDATLSALRAFRDDTLTHTPMGRVLVAVYESVSPPIAHTLSRHPDAQTTRFVRWLVVRCADLAHRRDETENSTPRTQIAYTILLVVLYVFGVLCAACGHLSIRFSEGVGLKPPRKRGPTDDRKSVEGFHRD